MRKPTRRELLASLADDDWFGTAIDDYSRSDLIEAGLRDPLRGAVQQSRDHPSKFFGSPNQHPFVRFTAATDADLMKLNAHSGRAVVLIAMGSYAPMHSGHVSLMEAADLAIRKGGDLPIAAVFSLHSEDRVKSKILPLRPDAPVTTEARRAEALEVLPAHLASGTSTFLDLWDASMPGGPRSFTDVMRRIVNTLNSLEIRNVTPVAVFGSDNGVSMRAFCRYGRCVCVIRPKHEHEADAYLNEPQMRLALREGRVLIAQRHAGGEISSTDIRNRRRSAL
ncbi:hypothetical protein [Kribbella sp. NPDC051718]|uniref:hypothetical protein n=1 Tax=Kribbella sp. NPDC051718 TaxID=3155168 RepID=UPI0034144637